MVTASYPKGWCRYEQDKKPKQKNKVTASKDISRSLTVYREGRSDIFGGNDE